jgi:hypothetical protein
VGRADDGMVAQSRSRTVTFLRHQVTVYWIAVLIGTLDVEDVRPHSARWVQFLREHQAG